MIAKRPESKQGTAEQIEAFIRPERRYEVFFDIAMGLASYAGQAAAWNKTFTSNQWKPVSRRAVATWWRREFTRHMPRAGSFAAGYARLGD